MNAYEKRKKIDPSLLGKKEVNILKRRYDIIKNFIVETLSEHNEITCQELDQLAVTKLKYPFDGKVGWYVLSVKLDLEARNLIERIANTGRHKIAHNPLATKKILS